MCNLGSANIRIGLAQQDTPLNVPHCIARRTTQVPKRSVQDQVTSFSQFPMIFLSFLNFLLFFSFLVQLLNSQVTTPQHMERERAYDIVSENIYDK